LQFQIGESFTAALQLEQLVAVTQITTRASTIMRIALAETTNLSVANTIDRLFRPVVNKPNVFALMFSRNVLFAVPALHRYILSGPTEN
jgi:hypothetical protein